MRDLAALRDLSELQYGVVARRQTRELGYPADTVRRLVASGDWALETPRVLRLIGAPRNALQRLIVPVLDSGPGAVVSGQAAAALWKIPGFPYSPVDVSMPRHLGGTRPATARLHRVYLPADCVTEVYGIPVTTLPKTLFDIAGSIHPDRLDTLVERVVAKSPGTLFALHHMLDTLGTSGRSGITAMRTVLAGRPPGYVATGSGLERRFERLLIEAHEEPLTRQVDVGGFEWLGRVDFVDLDLRILFEVDSLLHHTGRLAQLRDAAATRRYSLRDGAPSAGSPRSTSGTGRRSPFKPSATHAETPAPRVADQFSGQKRAGILHVSGP